jgi:hypothetical protein
VIEEDYILISDLNLIFLVRLNKESDEGRTRSTFWGARSAFNILIGKPQGKVILGDLVEV